MTSTLKPTLLLVTGRALAFAATFFIPVMLARLFAPSEFGTYKQLLLIYGTIYIIIPLGMAESLFYFLPRTPRGGGRQAANTLLMLTAAGIVTAWALSVFGDDLARALGNPSIADHVGLLGALLALTLAATPLEIVLISRNEHRAAAWSYGLSDIVRALLIIGAAVLVGTLHGVFAAAVVFGVLRIGATLAVLIREFGRELVPDLAALREQLAYAFPFGLAAIVESVQGNYHQYAVSLRFDAAVFAIYSVGCLQVPLVEWVAGPASNVMMVRMGEHRGDPQALVAFWHDTTRWLALLFVPVAVLLFVLAPDLIIFLFTPSYAAAGPILRIWSVITLLSILQTDGVLRAFAETPFLLALNVVRLAVVALSIPWLIDAFGLPGAALAAVAAAFVAKAVALGRIGRRLETGAADVLPWRALVATVAIAAVAALPAAIVRVEMVPASGGSIVATTAVYGAAYAALAAALLLTPEERRALLAWIGEKCGGGLARELVSKRAEER